MLFGFIYSPKQRYPGENVENIKTAVCERDKVEEVMNRIGFRTVATRTEMYDNQNDVFLFYGKVAGIEYPIAWFSLSNVNTGDHTVIHVAQWTRTNGAWVEIPMT